MPTPSAGRRARSSAGLLNGPTHRRYRGGVHRGLVGREQELTALVDQLPDPAGEGGGLVLVSGEAGIGKSRLVSALVDRVRQSGGQALLGRTTEQAGAPPYWPWLQLLEPLGAAPLLETPADADPQAERFLRFDAVARAI